MTLLQEKDKQYLKTKFENELLKPIKILVFVSDESSGFCNENIEMVKEVAELSSLIEWSKHDINDEVAKEYGIKYTPTTILTDLEGIYQGRIIFQGIPAGYEFSSFIEGIIDVSKRDNNLKEEIKQKLKDLNFPVNIDVYITHACPHCQNAVMTAHKFAQLNENITAKMIDAKEFPELASEHKIFSVPHTYINDKIDFVGALPVNEFLDKIFQIRDI